MFGKLGSGELIVIAVVAILVFGPSQLPKLGKMMGETVRSLRGIRKEINDTIDDVEK